MLFFRLIWRLRLIEATLCAGVAAFGLTSCGMVGPDYVHPKDRTPAAWHTQLQDGLTSETMNPQVLAKWWSVFNDPILTSLIEEAISNNLELKSAHVAREGGAGATRDIGGGTVSNA